MSKFQVGDTIKVASGAEVSLCVDVDRPYEVKGLDEIGRAMIACRDTPAFGFHHARPEDWDVITPRPCIACVHTDLREANIARSSEWVGVTQYTPTLFLSTELGGEVGEVLNVVKKLEREAMGMPGSRDTVEHLKREIGDVAITLDRLAERYGININEAAALAFNEKSEAMGFKTRYQPT